MILIIGSDEEFHSKHVYDNLCQKGEKVEFLDSRLIPVKTPLIWNPVDNSGYFLINNNKINFAEIKSIYWRWYYGIQCPITVKGKNSDYIEHIMVKEITSAAEGLFSSIKCKWVNSFNAIQMHKRKPYQLALMAENNIRVPKTIITNNPDAIIQFAEENNFDIIYKPVQGGASTKILQQDDLTAKRLKQLTISPVQFQEKIDGVDIRVYGIENDIMAAEIHANTIDFRSDYNAKIIPVQLPEHVIADCKKIMQLFDYKFTGIDIKTNSQGEYVFIEANPSPMFYHFEKQTGYPITEKLVYTLMN